jgi:hypothetical protein
MPFFQAQLIQRLAALSIASLRTMGRAIPLPAFGSATLGIRKSGLGFGLGISVKGVFGREM